MNKILSFNTICRREPQIQELYQRACDVRKKAGKDAYKMWHYEFKPVLTTLVGTRAKHPDLRSYDVFTLTIDRIGAALGLKV